MKGSVGALEKSSVEIDDLLNFDQIAGFYVQESKKIAIYSCDCTLFELYFCYESKPEYFIYPMKEREREN